VTPDAPKSDTGKSDAGKSPLDALEEEMASLLGRGPDRSKS
jgi:hypothetical protein